MRHEMCCKKIRRAKAPCTTSCSAESNNVATQHASCPISRGTQQAKQVTAVAVAGTNDGFCAGENAKRAAVRTMDRPPRSYVQVDLRTSAHLVPLRPDHTLIATCFHAFFLVLSLLSPVVALFVSPSFDPIKPKRLDDDQR